jgi:hypothetical protein
MAAVDHVDPDGYWLDPDGNVHPTGNEDGEQEIIATVTQVCSQAERILLTRALDRAARNNEKPSIATCLNCGRRFPESLILFICCGASIAMRCSSNEGSCVSDQSQM